MERQVNYCMSGQAHLPYLVASIYTLRRYWDGLIRVSAWPESIGVVRRMAADSRLGIEAVLRCPAYRGKNDQFLDKMKMVMEENLTTTCLYLDADTTVHGHIDRLLDAAESFGFCATQFNNWMAAGGMARLRVESLREFPAIPQHLIDATIDRPSQWPSVNGGVWAAAPGSPVLPCWYEWTMAATVPRHTFIADEKVLHILQPKFFPSMEMMTLAGGYWNCSTVEKFRPSYMRDADIIIRHYHGDSCVRPEKTKQGVGTWFPTYQHCLHDNIGGMAEWRKDVRNRFLDKLEHPDAKATEARQKGGEETELVPQGVEQETFEEEETL